MAQPPSQGNTDTLSPAGQVAAQHWWAAGLPGAVRELSGQLCPLPQQRGGQGKWAAQTVPRELGPGQKPPAPGEDPTQTETESPWGGNDRHTCLLGQCYLRKKCQSRREPGRRLGASWLPILPVLNSCDVGEAARAARPVQGHVRGGGDALRQDLALSPLVAALPPLAGEGS